MQISVYRYNPDVDKAPYLQDFDLEIPGGRDLMVLDVLELLKEKDPSVTYRRSCREGVCGSDGVNMNGKNGLACVTPLSEVVRGGKLTIKPLPGMPVIRDLVVDMEQFYKQYEKIKPYLLNDEQPLPRNGFNRRKIVKSWMDSTNVSFVPAVHLPARPSGGTRTSSSARRACSRPIDLSSTVVILQPKRDSQTLKTRLAFSGAAAS